MSELETPLQFAPVESIPEGHGQESAQTSGLRLDLLIEDPETIAALASYPEGRERNRFARTALRIGIIALNQAQGRIDTESVKHEGDRLVREMEGKLSEYRRQTEQLLANTLKEYFDPQNGRFNERVERLVRCNFAYPPLAVEHERIAELNRRMEEPGAAATANYLLIHSLPQNKKLRFDEEASFSLDPAAGAGNPGLILNKLICEGASLGFHVIATCDTYNNVMRMLSRKALSEFEMRVVFQMSANDSASLIESPAANNLGLHRAILYNGQQGWMETFRPYALPDEDWLTEAGQSLTRLND